MLALLLGAPIAGFVIGFLAGMIRHNVVRVIVAATLILFPLAFFLVPLLNPSASEDQRFGAAFGLMIFGVPIGLWTLFGTLGVFVGAAKARGPD